MKLITVFVCVVLLIFGSLNQNTLTAQPEASNWIFGDKAWLQFQPDSSVIALSGAKQYGYEAQASISDSLGNLLFYTNCSKVWNSNHELLLDGVLYDTLLDPHQSTTQGALILPAPGRDFLYYLINPAVYSLIDMRLDGGLGGVVSESALTPLYPYFEDSLGVSEKNTAVRHANGRDWWIAQLRVPFESGWQPDAHLSVTLLSEDGLQESHHLPILLSEEVSSSQMVWGEMAFTPEGDKLGMIGSSQLYVWNFDRCNGTIQEEIIRLDTLQGGYGMAFSPNGNYIYLSMHNTGAPSALYQLSLIPDQFGVFNVTKLFEQGGPYWNHQLELGPDNKIYVGRTYFSHPNDVYSIQTMNLSVINRPDLFGHACDLDTLTVSLGGNRVLFGLPNTVNYALGPLEGSDCDTLGSSTAVPETASIPQWQITPTVSTGWYSFKGPEQAKLLVYDVWGRTVWQGSTTSQQIDLTALPSGLYLVQAKWEDRQQAFRVVKQ